MNNSRRKSLEKLAERVEAAVSNFIEEIESIKEDLEAVRDEEQDVLDNMPENLQGSERYEISENAIDNMESAISELEDFADISSEDAISYINDAAE